MKNHQLTDAQLLAQHYLIAAVWADCEEGTKPRITKDARKESEVIAQQFLDAIGPAALELCRRAYFNKGYGIHLGCGYDRPWLAQMGHDLWSTCQGHGTGFWDRLELYTKLREHLTKAASMFSWVQFEQCRGWAYIG